MILNHDIVKKGCGENGTDMQMYDAIIERAARAISTADALLIGAGAGMGVDSGLPDFRGDQGFWNAYPPFRGRSFAEIANPRVFMEDPKQAWGFYGHRANLYRSTIPHGGFDIIRRWAKEIMGEYFVCTSNVDGHFQRSGFDEDRTVEVHGSIHYLQCLKGLGCSRDTWSMEGVTIEVDEESFRATSALPSCINCETIARPNILMFGDIGWVPMRVAAQEDRYEKWYSKVKSSNVVAIEFGAGTAIPTIRYECQRRSKTLIRVNPRDFHAPNDAISIPLNALEAILRIDKLLL
jgi:NAD-dependent SIR2 family protein deacetylase